MEKYGTFDLITGEHITRETLMYAIHVELMCMQVLKALVNNLLQISELFSSSSVSEFSREIGLEESTFTRQKHAFLLDVFQSTDVAFNETHRKTRSQSEKFNEDGFSTLDPSDMFEK